MNKLVIGSLDTSKDRLKRTQFFASAMLSELQGDGAAEEIQTFVASYEASMRYHAEEFRKLLSGNESDFSQVAGRLKYMGASLEILKACGKVAATTDGLCRQIAGLCMSNIYGDMEGLKDTLEHTQMAAQVHHIDEPTEIRSP